MKKNNLQVTFLGAAGTVTGSKYLIENQNQRILVDCGLFQGLKELRNLNWQNPPIDVSTIDAIVLTHGHLDHCGYLPRLVKLGFKGVIYGSAATVEIAKIIIADSAKIQEEDAERANQHGYSKHEIAKPLYTLDDVAKTLPLFQNAPLDKWVQVADDFEVRFQLNGHILGSTFIEVKVNDQVLVFSGDIGQEKDVMLRAPLKPKQADYLFIESTYGDRLHQKQDTLAYLEEKINATIEKGGTIIIPAFAVERAQVLMYYLYQLKIQNRLPEVPLIMDSPMATDMVHLFQKFHDFHQLSHQECADIFSTFKMVGDHGASKKVVASDVPKIVVAASGMATGGRVLSYLAKYIGDDNSTILLVGFQAEGTRGRQMLDGCHEVKMYGKFFKVRAEIGSITGLSAHGDQSDLLNWVNELQEAPKKVFIVHGERQASDAFRVKLMDQYHWNIEIPSLYQTVVLD